MLNTVAFQESQTKNRSVSVR